MSVKVMPNRQTVHRGDNLEVSCDVDSENSSPAMVSWRRIGAPMSGNVQILGNLLKYVTVVAGINILI